MPENSVNLVVDIIWDEGASVYVSTCEGIGLALESESYDKLIQRVRDAISELLELNNIKSINSFCIHT